MEEKISQEPSDFSSTGEFIPDEQSTQNLINPLKILNLCTNLSSHTTSIGIQIILNKFLQEITGAPYAFIIPILANSEEGLIQVVGDKVLDKEMRFSITADNIRNASTSSFEFYISDLNRDFKEVIKMLVGTENNTLYYDIRELNKNLRSILPQMIPLDEVSVTSSATGLTNCSSLLNDDLTTLPRGKDGHMAITFFVCIAGDESCRIYYRYCIYETLRFTIGQLLTAIELNEERRLSGQCQKLLGKSRNLLGQIGTEKGRSIFSLIIFIQFNEKFQNFDRTFFLIDCELIENNENHNIRTLTMKYDILKSNCTSNKYVYESKDFDRLLQGIIAKAQELTGAERCSLFLRDKYTGELISKVPDDNKNPVNAIQIQSSMGIAGHVAETGKLLNIPRTTSNALFNKSIDQQIGFNTRNILCFPIYDRKTIIGVVQFYNKLNGYHFDKRDEQVAKAFSIYIGIAIMNILTEKSVQYTKAKHKVSQELINYHMKISQEEVNELVESLENLSKNRIPDLSSFTFRTRELDRTETFKATLQMFTDLDFIKKFRIRPEKLARFLIVAERGYRDLPFHNWMHGFTVAHFAYTLLMNCKLVEKGIFSELEALSFFISSLCHDIDHRASTNVYHQKSRNPLAQLYSREGSINERHHFTITLQILQEKATKILEYLSKEQFHTFLEITKEFILSTDLAHHFNILKQLVRLRRDNCTENKHMTMSLLITCCDLSDQIKEWPTTQQVSGLIYNEFFAQGDLEKQMGTVPPQMRDRKKAKIPKLQSDFIVDVVMPTFEVLGNILPETNILLEIIKDNLEHWQMILQSDNEQSKTTGK